MTRYNHKLHFPELLTFDDVQIIPQYSDVESRSTVSLTTQFTRNYKIDIPIVAAPMDTVCDHIMATTLGNMGGVGVIHRFSSIEEQANQVKHVLKNTNKSMPVAAAIGANGDYLDRAYALLNNGVHVLCIDVAHGEHVNVQRAIGELKGRFGGEFTFDIVAGNVATSDGCKRLISWGADAVRLGIGGGSVCETRIRTGVGIPQFHAVYESCEALQSHDIPIISDGGIRYPGDIVKALAAGASSVMIGSLLAGTYEAPGDVFIAGEWPNNSKFKMFRGSASATIKLEKNGTQEHVEGASKMVPLKGSVKDVIYDICDGIRSGASYVGAHNLNQLRQNAEFVRISQAGLREARPHLLL